MFLYNHLARLARYVRTRPADPAHRLPVVAALLLAAIVAAPSGTHAQKLPKELRSAARLRAIAGITAKRAAVHLNILASDRMMGRDTPSPELDSAAAYIADRYRAFGLLPVDGSYLHGYTINRRRLGGGHSMAIDAAYVAPDSGFAPLSFSGGGSVVAPLVFAGYGITKADSGYDDYANTDVRGSVVVVLEGEPRGRASLHLGIRQKIRVAMRRGAVAVLVAPNPEYVGLLYPYVAPATATRSSPSVATRWALAAGSGDSAVPAAIISRAVLAELLAVSSDGLDSIARQLNTGRFPGARPLNRTLSLTVNSSFLLDTVYNVVGMVPGRGHNGQYVVVGAHYDHIGHNAAAIGPDSIFNGADDNASGTTGVLLAAQAMGGLPINERPLRNTVFMAFSGEELGLLGSRAWVEAPRLPLDSIAAMINMDMIGRNRRDSVGAAGRDVAPELLDVLAVANRAEPMKIGDWLENFFNRSDQASFADKRIPSLFLSSGLHPDYHRPGDEAGKIDMRKLAHITRLCFRTLLLIADAPVRPRFLDPGE